MNLSSVKPGDIVRVEKKGRTFLAVAGGRDNGGITVEPIEKGITYTMASAREVTALWRKSKRSRT